MDIKFMLRRMRLPREIYYKFQLKKQLAKIPKDLLENSFSNIEKLKGKYAGQRCFIIGNGPSLITDDLEKLKNEITFGTNRIFTIYNKTEWRPTFYAIQDDLVMGKMMSDLGETIKQSEFGFVSTNNYFLCREALNNIENVLWMPLRFCPPNKNIYRFSNDIKEEVFEGLTITYSCMQLAAYMGFSEIYILGVDHNYPIEIDDDGNIVRNDDSVKAYFGEAMVSMSDINLPKVVEMTRAYISAEKFSRKNGFRIYNATRGGKLEAFERVNFDELFNE